MGDAVLSRAAVTGVILAGGEGRRMGGIDKGLAELDGRPLVAHALARLAPQVDVLAISANRNAERYAAFGVPVLADVFAGFAGPLAGLHAALARATTPLVACVPCDSPFFPPELVARLREALDAQGADLAVPRAGGREQRAFCLARRNLEPELARFLAAGGRRVGDWQAALRVAPADFDDDRAFANLNTADELCAAQRFVVQRENSH